MSRVHHQIGAVADHDDDLGIGHRHLGAPAAGDLVAHAGIAELAVERAGGLDLPVLGQLARQAPGGGDDAVLLAGLAVHRAHDLRVARKVGVGGPGALLHDLVPRPVERFRLLGPRGRRPVAGDRRVQLGHRLPGVGDDGQRKMLAGVETRGVDADELEVLVLKHRPRAGREILQPRADRHHDIGLAGERVGGGRADDAEGSGIQRMRVGHDAAAGDGLDDRNGVLVRERREFGAGLGIVDAAAGDDQRPLGLAQHAGGAGDLAAVGAGTARLMHALVEEALGIVIGFALRILAEGQECRSAVGRVEHGGDRLRAGIAGSAPAG